MPAPKHIIIIGGGFCGTMTAVNIMRGAKNPLKITLINSGAPVFRGVAYTPYSETHLLNVAAGNMSAFPEDLTHFTNWVHAKQEYNAYEKDILAKAYLPRSLYGEYLSDVWDIALAIKRSDTELTVIEDYVCDLEFVQHNQLKAILKKGSPLTADYVVLATGNSLPRDLPIKNMEFYSSSNYYRNPWSVDSVSNLNNKQDVLIIGNGLTMVDTVIGLVENGFTQKIYSLSPHGFGILPHRHFGLVYTGLVDEIEEPFELMKLFKLIHKHIKKVRKLGISAGPVVDSIRPYSHKIWQSFSLDEKKQFLKRFRHFWGVARHRLPIIIYDIIRDLRIKGQLIILQGKLVDIEESDKGAVVTYYDSKEKKQNSISVERVINCTGPETSIHKTINPLLRRLAEKGIITSDSLELGINANILTYNTITAEGTVSSNLFTLGSNLKGMLWEAIAVPELRVQCRQLSNILLQACEQN